MARLCLQQLDDLQFLGRESRMHKPGLNLLSLLDEAFDLALPKRDVEEIGHRPFAGPDEARVSNRNPMVGKAANVNFVVGIS
ncbi:hypothetical protein SPBR_01161 [Sporothrix brasiliensis 5110]|uniref:Uncharacterized protein n=1 Tax=Sporothrix brasiliensis 5110 TaxID=1398154 RepID=A0A0C2ETZ4_9PEZI|nr:uncharacterized protein SPBR_01161 [Sporothrix brasiliensis 5110]KIH90009.1 hypothetical protein SPBR_01161 [Sporothrix brasiliensis 5110]